MVEEKALSHITLDLFFLPLICPDDAFVQYENSWMRRNIKAERVSQFCLFCNYTDAGGSKKNIDYQSLDNMFITGQQLYFEA